MSMVSRPPPGIKRTSWSTKRRRIDARAQQSAWRRRRSRNATVSVPRNKLAFPTAMRTKLRFVQRVEFSNATAGGIAKYAFRANSLTDPTVTGTVGHQPRGFDQYMGVYRTYTVLGSTISVNFMYNGYDGPSALDSGSDLYLIKTNKVETTSGAVAALSPTMCGIHKGVTELDATTETAAKVMEQDRSIWKAMTPQDGAIVLSTKMRTSDFFGKGTLVGAEGYTGTIIADAENQIYYDVWCARASNTTAGICHTVGFITIEYDVQFTEPKTLGQS